MASLKLESAFGSVTIFTMLIPLIKEHGMSSPSSSVPFLSVECFSLFFEELFYFFIWAYSKVRFFVLLLFVLVCVLNACDPASVCVCVYVY